jgi:ParB-like chromosome segregation protein Spo0J
MSAIFRNVPHKLITPEEGFNVRKRFNAEKGAELRASIREHGIRNALEVVQLPGEEERYKIVAGERRWRENGGLLEDLKREVEAARDEGEIARLQALWKDRFEVPVRVLAEEEVPQARMLNLIENLLREDITAAEEADGYFQALQEVNPETGALYTIAELSRKLGHRDSGYVERRLKLRQAPRVLLDAIEEGKVAATVAELVGRIPDPKAREEVAKLILKPVDPAPEQEVPLNYLQTKQLIREHFMIRIDKGCGFDPDQEDLVPIVKDKDEQRVRGGACKDCPMRSGMSEELQGEMSTVKAGKGRTGGVDPNLCTNPSCFRAKQDAAWQITKRLSEQKGDKVIEGDAAEKLFSGWQGDLAYDAKYSRGNERIYSSAPIGSPANQMTLAQIAQGLKVPAVVAKNPHTGKVEHLVDKKAVLEKAKKEKPELFKVAKGSGNSGVNDEEKKRKERCKKYEAINRACATALFEKISAKGIGLEEQMVVFEDVLDGASDDACRMMGQWLEITLDKSDKSYSSSGRRYNKKILAHVKEHGTTLPALQAFTFIMMIAGHLKASMWCEGNNRGDAFDAMVKAYGVDCKAIAKQVTDDLARQGKKKGDAEKGRRGEGEKKTVRSYQDAAKQKKWEEIVAVARRADNETNEEVEQWLEAVAETYGLPVLDCLSAMKEFEELLEKALLEEAAWGKGVERCDVCHVPLEEGAPEGEPHVCESCGGEWAWLLVTLMKEAGGAKGKGGKAKKKTAKKAAKKKAAKRA